MIFIFIESKHILLKDITNTIDKYFFTNLSIAKREKNTIDKMVLIIYKNNM